MRRKAEEAMFAKQKKVSPVPPPQTLSAILKDQQPVNVWAAGGALKAKNNRIGAPSSSSKGAKGGKATKPLKPVKPAKPTKAKKGKQAKGAKQSKAAKQTKPKQQTVSNGSTSAWTSRAAVATNNVNGSHGVHGVKSKTASQPKGGAKKGSSNNSKAASKRTGSTKATKNGKSHKSRGNNSSNNHHHFGQQNNRNIEAVNKVSPELQHWLRTEIKKLNPDVEAVSVAHLLLTLDDDTVRTTAVHTFGNNGEVSTFIDSFLTHRSHDLQEQKHKGTSKVKVGGRGGHKKKNNKSRR